MQKLSSVTLDWPTDWSALFGEARPLIVEIGFGNGDYLLHLAEKHPDANLIGLEISNKSLAKAEGKIEHSDYDHVRVIHARAETALHHLFTPESVSAFHINYPDPWFKSRHSGRRLMQRDTVDAIVSRLIPGGMLYLATDIVEYAEMSDELLQETPGLDNMLDAAWVHDLPGRFRTKYEEKGLREGRPGHYFIYRRNEQPAPSIPVIKELEMPHLVMQSPLTPEEMLAKFERMTFDTGDSIYVTFIGSFISQNERALLFETNIEEPTISQHIALMLFPRSEAHTYTIKYASLGHPRITLGLHRATKLLGDWLVSLHDEAEILAHRIKTET